MRENNKGFDISIKLLEDSSQRIHSILELSPVATAIVDEEGNIYYGNRACADLLYCELDKLVKNNMQTFLSDNEWNEFQLKFTSAASSTSVMSTLGRLSDKYKIPVVLTWQIVEIRAPRNKEKRFLIMGVEVTEVEYEKSKLRHLNDNLEQIVKDKTKDIEDVADKMIGKAKDAGKAEVIIDILHLMGNVLCSITTMVTLLKSSSDQSSPLKIMSKFSDSLKIKNKEIIGDSHSFSNFCMRFIDEFAVYLSSQGDQTSDLLKRLEDKISFLEKFLNEQNDDQKSNLLYENKVLFPLVNNNIIKYRKKINSLGGELSLQFNIDKSFKMNILPRKFEYVINQLLLNAVESLESKLIPKEQVRNISVSVDTFDEGIVFLISDNGIGIPYNDETKIFSCGYTTKEDKLGVGLHQAANFLTEMGGSLSLITSIPLEKTTFKVIFKSKT